MNDENLEPKITALAPWFGSKRNIAPAIVDELGKHRVYWEPFCGSCAVLLAKPPCVMETAVDLHGDLINLARVLQIELTAIDLYGRLNRLIFHEDLFKEAADRCKARGHVPTDTVPNVDHALDFLITGWFGRNGVAGTANYNLGFCVRFTANGGHAAKRWAGVVESIPAWHLRLRNVTFLNRDAFVVLDRIDDAEGTVLYVDPPYLVKGAKYVHDFATADHERLAHALRRFKSARVVVSYYAHPELATLYPGWNQREIIVSKSLVNVGQRDQTGTTKVTEILLSNNQGKRISTITPGFAFNG